MIGRMFPPQGYGVEIEPYDYCIFTDNDGYIKAKNGKTGRIDFSGTDASTVIQSAINAVGVRGMIVIKGDIVFNSPIQITKPIIYHHYGTMILNMQSGEAGIVIGDASNRVYNSDIYIHRIYGQDKTRDAIKILNGKYNRISVNWVNYCRYAFYIKQESQNVELGENYFYYSLIDFCKKGLYISAPPSGQSAVWAEGTQMCGGGIANCDEHGILIENGANAGGLFVTGFIDNYAISGAMDYVNYMDSTRLGSTLCLKFIRENYCVFHPKDILINPDTGSVSVGSSGKLNILPDITIEREGTDTFRTYDTLVFRGSALIAYRHDNIDEILNSQITTESYRRFVITADGYIAWGPGSADLDTRLYRASSGLLALGTGNGLRVPGAVRTFVKAGAPTDSDIPSPEDGAIVVDSANNRLWVRVGGVWKYVSLT